MKWRTQAETALTSDSDSRLHLACRSVHRREQGVIGAAWPTQAVMAAHSAALAMTGCKQRCSKLTDDSMAHTWCCAQCESASNTG